MRISKLSFCIVAMCCLSACRTTYMVSQNKVLVFGSGGGITGMVTTYLLTADGKLYTMATQGTKTLLKEKIRAIEVNELFEEAKQLKDPKMQCNRPGNMYYFLYIFNQDSNPDCMWGENGFTPSAEVLELYNELMELTI